MWISDLMGLPWKLEKKCVEIKMWVRKLELNPISELNWAKWVLPWVSVSKGFDTVFQDLTHVNGFVFRKSCLYKYANQWQWKVQYKWGHFLFKRYTCLLSINSSESCVGLHQWCISQIWTQSPFQIHMTYQRKTPMLDFKLSHKAHPWNFFEVTN
jgi:hypothetical protein